MGAYIGKYGNFILLQTHSTHSVHKQSFSQCHIKKNKSANDVFTDFSVAGAVRFELTTRGFGVLNCPFHNMLYLGENGYFV